MSEITSNIDLALLQLNNSGIVAIPTETVYGLAGNAENEVAIKKIYELKKRPSNHPLIMHVGENWDLTQWASMIPDYAKQLIKQFWPGPLTLVMNCKPGCVNPLITGGQDTVAIRCPKHPITQALLQQLGFPLVAPSANPFGKISPTTAKHVQDSFANDELLILDGGRCEVGIESTIIAATDPNNYEILRPGVIDEDQIAACVSYEQIKSASSIRVPGKLASHYQPEKPLYCFTDFDALQEFYKKTNQLVYTLSFKPMPQAASELSYQLTFSPEQTAFELYYQLRCADQSNAEIIAIELPPDQPSWLGVRERIIKASNR